MGTSIKIVERPAEIVEFNYDELKPGEAKRVRAAGNRIRGHMVKSVVSKMEIGLELLEVKNIIRHGQFIAWMIAEFGPAVRLLQQFMTLAAAFGSKPCMIADLPISPTALCLVAAPSVAEEARETVIARAQRGEKITVAQTKDIIAKARKKQDIQRRPKASADWLARAKKSIEGCIEHCPPEELAEVLLELHASLEGH